MDATEALIAFLTHAIRGHRRDRYIGFAPNFKGRRKILGDFYHRFHDCIDPAKIAPALPRSAWQAPAYSFAAPNEFGTKASSLRSAYDTHTEAFLVITRDGHYGVHCEEAYSGNGGTREFFISLPPPSAT